MGFEEVGWPRASGAAQVGVGNNEGDAWATSYRNIVGLPDIVGVEISHDVT